MRVLDPSTGPARLLIGRDTRESGAWIERELAYGAQLSGATVVAAGVLPTPAVAYLTRTSDVTLGAVISASHNPFEDNGIKVFSGGGQKFTEELERRVEQAIADDSWSVEAGDAPALAATDLTGRYRGHLREVLADAGGLRGATVVVDCANGATTSVAPQVFADLGFDVDLIGASPDGRNINLGCGSTHPEAMAARVVERGAIAGVAFDGDGDRAILADEHGRLVDGDGVMLMCARQMKAEGRLRGNTVVATVMSNIGLELALSESGIALRRTQVGDKYVMEEIRARGLLAGRRTVRSCDLLRLPVHRRWARDGVERLACDGHHRQVALVAGQRAGDLPAGAGQRPCARAARSGIGARDCRGHGARRIGDWSATAACWSATRAPSRCCASCSKAATARRSRRGRTKSRRL